MHEVFVLMHHSESPSTNEIKTEIGENSQNVAFQNSKNSIQNGLILNNGTTFLTKF